MLRTVGGARWSDARGRVVAAVVVLQVLVPAVALVVDPPTRFGFQMYSGLGGVQLEVLDGSEQPLAVGLDEVLPGPLRPELDWVSVLPEHVCATVARAAEVRVVQSGTERTLRC